MMDPDRQFWEDWLIGLPWALAFGILVAAVWIIAHLL